MSDWDGSCLRFDGGQKIIHIAFRLQDSLSCHSLCRFSCESGRHLHGSCAMTYLPLTKSSTLPQVIVVSDAWIIGRSCSINKSHISTTWAVLHMKRPGLALSSFKVAPPFLEGAGGGGTRQCAQSGFTRTQAFGIVLGNSLAFISPVFCFV